MKPNLFTSNSKGMAKEMQLFLKKVLKALSLAFILLLISSELIVRFPNVAQYFGYTKQWIKVVARIKASNEVMDSDTLFIGDSVGAQIFPFNRKNQLTTNRSIYVVGNFILASNAFRYNPGLKVLVYATVPQVIGDKFEQSATCHNFIKPFFNRENDPHFDQGIKAKLQRRKSYHLYKYNLYKVLPIDELDFEDHVPKEEDRLSDFSIEWIKKLKILCESNNVELILVSPPVAKQWKVKSNDWEKIREQVANTDLEELFDRYLNNVVYLDEHLMIDEFHWNKKYIEENRNILIQKMMNPGTIRKI